MRASQARNNGLPRRAGARFTLSAARKNGVNGSNWKVSARRPGKRRQIGLPIWLQWWRPAQVLSSKKSEAQMDLKQKLAPVGFRSTRTAKTPLTPNSPRFQTVPAQGSSYK